MEIAFKKQIAFYIDDAVRKIEAIVPTLSEEDFWSKPSKEVLTIGNQLIHLEGNMKQWVLQHLDGRENTRTRDLEFVVDKSKSKAEVWASFFKTITEVKQVLEKDHDLMTTFVIQGHETNGLGIWIHMAEHISYHTGQIVYAAKVLQNKQFDFYADWALNDK